MKRRVAAARGRWPLIAAESGLDYQWLNKVMQGRIADPGVTKVERVLAAIDRIEAQDRAARPVARPGTAHRPLAPLAIVPGGVAASGIRLLLRGPRREGFAVIDDDLLLIGLWAWMRANPSCTFDEFRAANSRALALLS